MDCYALPLFKCRLTLAPSSNYVYLMTGSNKFGSK